ncbi:MAG: 3-hydroxybutyryl-CoA dehydratase [Flavobacteriales bacterium]|jgi:3-hydroxybutyryl-CoA dehydratase
MFALKDVFKQRFVVSEEVYTNFISLSKDMNVLHVDDEFARLKGFKGKVMHGNILNGFLSYFIGECLPLNNVIIHSQTIQYKLPVYLKETLELVAHVDGIFESVNAVEFKYSFTNDDGKTVAKGKIQIGILR